MILTVGLMVLMFWQQVLMFLMILTEGFCFWRRYNKSCYWQKVLSFEDAVIRKFPSHPPHPIAAYLGLCCEKLWSASPTNICSFKTKVGGELPSLQDIYTRRCTRKARRIIKDSSHPSHRLLSLLPSGRRFRSIRSRTSRLRDSFFPQAIRLMNSHK